ncbi:MAG: hypothetical protein A3J72_02455 [Nitrospirae bacterium RIFCSPHIGHO2_02_FULL_40_19]|nr:MAG: hypothetical protein A3J72_02455 [Nitrospirae bacterium RIFCSPHIGHO2_02_FULL_40_19]
MSANEKDPDWVINYLRKTISIFQERFGNNSRRFPDGEACISNYIKNLKEYYRKGQPEPVIRRTLEEIHNELCVADALLQCNNPFFTTIRYEPSLPRCNKTIDYVCVLPNSSLYYVDVKTIMPESIDGWKKFLNNKKYIPTNIEVILEQDLMGGEIWHRWYASRGRMLEYTIELENKISECGLCHESSVFVLVFCGNGSDWHVSRLEDFVAFYKTASHRYDDAFSEMEKHYLKEQNIQLQRSISRFAYFERSFGFLEPKKIIWNIQPPFLL